MSRFQSTSRHPSRYITVCALERNRSTRERAASFRWHVRYRQGVPGEVLADARRLLEVSGSEQRGEGEVREVTSAIRIELSADLGDAFRSKTRIRYLQTAIGLGTSGNR